MTGNRARWSSVWLIALAAAIAFVMLERPISGQAANRPGTLTLTVVSSVGKPIGDVKVTVSGNVDRAGTTGADGTLSFQLPAGTYRVRMRHEKYETLEKEVTIRAAGKLAAEGMMTDAPPPPAPPPPPPAPEPKVTMPDFKPGPPVVLSIPDLFDQMQRSLRDTPTVERELGCSGGSSSRIIMTRENVASHAHADADEMLYVVGGEATVNISGKDQNVDPGSFALVPRGATHGLTRRGRNVLVLLSIRSGPPCPGL